MISEEFGGKGLSAGGRRRREEILRSALLEAGRRRARWYVVRGAGVALIAMVMVAVMAKPKVKAPSHEVVQGPARTVDVAPPRRIKREILITRIETDPTIAQRLAVPVRGRDWIVLSDDELVRQLASAGRPAGLQYVKGRTELLWR